MTEATHVIVYPSPVDGSLCFLIPTGSLPIEETARKDVPEGIPYKVLPRPAFPKDVTFMEAWEADFSIPDGYGIGQKNWFNEHGVKV